MVALQNDNSLWTWGSNTYGQLGQGTDTYSTIPVNIGTDFDWQNINAGYLNTSAITNDERGKRLRQFWYYYKRIFPEDPNNLKTVADVNVPVEVEKNDVIMLMVTDANLGGFSYGFIDDLYNFYFKE